MYSITQDIENSEFNGWLNPEILIKNNRRQEGNRKRGYDLANIDLNEECDDIRRRVLRPRHDTELDNLSDASRTRPIHSNRLRQRQIERNNNQTTNSVRIDSQGPVVPDLTTTQSNVNDFSLLQALAAYNWPQNYLLLNTDASLLHRIQHATYPNLSNVHMSQRIPQFDPWVLHNYLLAASYGAASTSHVSPDSNSDDVAAVRMSQMAYPSMTNEINRSNSILWQYPLFFNQPLSNANQSNNRSSRPVGPANMESPPDLSYYLRFIDYSQRDSVSASNDNRLFQGMYSSDPRISNFCNPILQHPFPYPSVCPYHSSGHILHNTNQSLNHSTGSGSTQSEPVSSQSQNSFNNFPHSSTITFDQFWPHITPAMRPLNYSLNGSNIDTLLHLAAHFEQRKRGITKEELDKLPTHRYKATSEKHKHKDKNVSDAKANSKEDIVKCLVCLEDFEPKQNIRVLRCDHEFHAKCIDKWLKINRTCPLCRADAFDGSAQKDGA